MTRRWGALLAIAALGMIQCGGSTDTNGSSGGSSGVGGSGASGGSTGGSGGSTGGSGGSTGGSGGASPDMFACQVNSDCLLRSASCCGQCGAATRGDAVALNKSYASEYATGVCATVGDCPGCFMPQDPTLLATCRAGQCAVVDLLTHPSTECQSPSDCRVRATECCECGSATDPEHLIAISVSGDAQYSQLVCDPNTGCFECAPVYPPVSLGCIDGHCQIVTGN